MHLVNIRPVSLLLNLSICLFVYLKCQESDDVSVETHNKGALLTVRVKHKQQTGRCTVCRHVVGDQVSRSRARMNCAQSRSSISSAIVARENFDIFPATIFRH